MRPRENSGLLFFFAVVFRWHHCDWKSVLTADFFRAVLFDNGIRAVLPTPQRALICFLVSSSVFCTVLAGCNCTRSSIRSNFP